MIKAEEGNLMDFMEIMDLILKYGSDKQKLGIMICKNAFSTAEYQDLEDHKRVVLDQICNAIMELTK